MGSFIQLLRDLGPAKLAALGVVAMAFIAGFIVLSIKLSTPPMVPLYSNLDIKDSGKIVNALEAQGVPYELRANGTQIMVPESRVLRLRMTMAQEGIPSKGSLVGYEIFDNSETLGTSSFVQNVNLLRALEGELGRTIASIANIESARVHLVVPKRELFTRDRQEPSASVMLQLRGKNNLSKQEISAISHLVATAVPGLEVGRITIIDNMGKPFHLGARNEDDPDSVASTAEEYRTGYENRLKNTIEDLLEKSVGMGKVQAQISAEINFDRTVTNAEIYDPNGQVARSVQTVEEKQSSSDKNTDETVSVANNLPNAGANNKAGGGSQSANNSQRTDETTNFEISKTIKNQISQTGTVKRLSVAVLVDGYYNVNSKTGEVTYTARPEKELQQLETLAKSAVGFDASRGDKFEIVNLQFTTDLNAMRPETTVDWLKKELHGILQTLVIATVVILVILMVIRPIASRAFAFSREQEEADAASALAIQTAAAAAATAGAEASMTAEESESMIAIENIEARSKSASYKTMSDLVDKYPEETLSVIRNWINRDG